MTSRERVVTVIRHGVPDRIPIYGWLKSNLEEQISAEFGSVEAFEDRYEFDFAHVFGGPARFPDEALKAARAHGGGEILPEALLGLRMNDPDDSSAYEEVRAAIRHHKTERGRFVYMQTPGIFEALNGPFGIENHLAYLLLYPVELREVYRRQAEWNRSFAMNCLDLGIDMIHVSDDWGAQRGLLFGKRIFDELIVPNHLVTARAVKERGAFLSLHSDGNVSSVLDDVVAMGYDVMHPYQESAGMDYGVYRRSYSSRLALMGGLDVQTTIGFGRKDHLAAEIERVMRLFARGGLLYCTTHFVQAHCGIDELVFAYDTVYRLARDLVA
jgi:uroporphyrinogen decarboxylase